MVRWAFDKGLGDISEPTEVGDKYVVAIIVAVNKAGLMGVGEARPLCENLVRNAKKAKIIIDTKIKGNTLETIASSTGSSVQKADSVSFASPFIPSIGSEPKVIGASFNKALRSKASDPIVGTSGVFAVRVESNGAKPATTDVATIKQGLIQSARMAAYRGLEALKKSATIKDNRSKFY